MAINFYKGESMTITFIAYDNSDPAQLLDISGYTKAVTVFTPYTKPAISLTVTPISNSSFSVTVSAANTVAMNPGDFNIVVKLTDASGGVKIGKSIPCKLIDPNITTAAGSLTVDSGQVSVNMNIDSSAINFDMFFGTVSIVVDGAVLDTDPALGGATPSDIKVPSQKAVKTYADNKVSTESTARTSADTALDTKISNTSTGHDHDGTDSKKIDHSNLENKGTNTHAQIDSHIASTTNPHSVTKAQVGLSNVDNTSDANKPISTAQAAVNAAKADLVGGRVPSEQLPAYVGDVLEYDNLAAFPALGEAGKIYVARDTNLTYRWSGSAYVEIGKSLALGETSATAYRGDRGKTAYDHTSLTNNPHGTTKSHVGLGNVDNTSDANKPVSTAQQAALDLKVDKVTGKGLSTNDYDNTEKAAVANSVRKTGDETIAGVKTFSASPIVPTPTADTQAAPKKYVDDADALKVDKTAVKTARGTSTTDVMSQKTVTDELVQIEGNLNDIAANVAAAYTYGIEFDTGISSPTCTRIGNSDLHRTLPIQSRIRGCLLNDSGEVIEYLNPTNWNVHTLDGSNGQVMVEIPEHWRKFETDGTKRRVYITEFKRYGFHFVPKSYVSAFEATFQRSTGKLCSVVNNTADYRGGDNQAAWDGTYRTVLGRPTTVKSRTEFRAAARLRNASVSSEWNCQVYEQYKTIFWLFVIEYATLNSQLAYNAAKDGNGYAQGGLGNGATVLDSTKWNAMNGYYPFLSCGVTNSLGNNSGEVAQTMPFEYDASGAANYAGEYSALQAYTVGKYISSGNLLYRCILDAPAGTELTNVTYFTPVTRTVIYANRYRGIENPFGHIWKWTDGINIEVKTDADGGTSRIYVATNPAIFNDANYVGFEMRGLEARADGYVKTIVFGEFGDIMPLTVGGGSTAYFCDYHYTSITSSSFRGVLFGGAAHIDAYAGFAFANSVRTPSAADANIGSRLCFLPE